MQYALRLLCIAPLLLAGCVMTDPEPAEPAEPVGTCGAAELQYLVGEPGRVLNGMRFSQDVRVIQPGMAVTMDFRSDRLNIWLNDLDRIERVTCG
jgi:hypothetical protein